MEKHDHNGCCGEEAERFPLRLAVSAALLIGGLLLSFAALPGSVPLVLYILSYLIAGFPVLIGAVKGIREGEIFGEAFLMSIASLGAFCIGEFAEGCAVMLLFEAGEWLTDQAVDSSRDSIRAAIEMRPDTVRVLRKNKEETLSPEEVQIGDILLVLPGEKVACDGILAEGAGTLDVSALTGESLPESVCAGDRVLSGSIARESALRVRVTALYRESTVAKILDLIENARSRKSKAEQFIHRFAKVYTPAVCALAVGIAVIPPLFGMDTFANSVYRGLCALAASCPCALVLSVPLGLFCGLGAASRDGLLVKGGNYLELLARIDGIALDKTGTLTAGHFSPIGEEPAKDAEALRFALSVCERYSTHPIAVSALEAYGKVDSDITAAAALPGLGVCASANGHEYLCGSARLFAERGIAITPASLPGTAVYAARDGEFLGSVTFADRVKPDSAAAAAALSELGLSLAMFTGDRRDMAKSAAKEVGIESIEAELLPQDKVTALAKRKADGKLYAFVGDGINDAPVLAAADIGIAIGDVGSAAALEAADAVLTGESLQALPKAIRTARRTVRIVRQNIVFSLAVKVLIVLAAALGCADMWLAVFGDVGVCLLAVLNALRILKK